VAKKEAKPKVSAMALLEDAKVSQSTAVDLNQITECAVEMIKIGLRLTKWQEEAKKLQDRYAELETQVLPDLMFKAGMDEFTLTGGVRLVIQDILTGSIPSKTSIENCDDPVQQQVLEARRKAAFDWLRKNKAKDLIRATLRAEFGPGDTAIAKKYYNDLRKAGYKVSSDENVHPQTLNKFLREKIASGALVPLDTFSVFNGKRAKLVPPKNQ
jgi:hypothetical protein